MFVNETTRETLKWYTAHPGQIVHYADVADALKMKKENVNAALNRMVKVHPEFGISREALGFFVYRPPSNSKAPEPAPEPEKPPSPELLEILGSTKAGTILARDSEGRLYSVEEM